MVKSIRFSDIFQSRVLASDEQFDLALGFVGPDFRSIKNLAEVSSQAHRCWAFTAQDCTDTAVSSAEMNALKVRANLTKLQVWVAKSWNQQALAEMAEALKDIDRERSEYRVFVDVSAFPRRMLAALLDAIRDAVADGFPVRLTLGYRLALFTKPRDGEAPPNRRVAPAHSSVAGWPRLPGLPVHLIVGLGYERGKALGAVEYIQPAHLSLFSPESPEPRFAKQVSDRNRELLDGSPAEAVYSYQVLDPAAQFAQLSSMLAPMLIDAKPVLLPFGPKVFFAICVLLSFNFSEVAVWHVSGEEDEEITLVRPSEHAVYIRFSLTTDSMQENEISS